MLFTTQALLHNLLKSWRSRYMYTLTFNSAGLYTIYFDTEWSRAPTPHCPVPDVRVSVQFALHYGGGGGANAKNRDSTFSTQPSITYRIDYEDFVHQDLNNIDHHILRVIKFKSMFFKSHPLDFEHADFFDSRLQ